VAQSWSTPLALVRAGSILSTTKNKKKLASGKKCPAVNTGFLVSTAEGQAPWDCHVDSGDLTTGVGPPIQEGCCGTGSGYW
jgi:hypothetical protein